MQLKQHPLSAAFPSMSDDDALSLRDSIENIGVQNPITIYEGMVLDGWHRYQVAQSAGLECPMVELGDVDPQDFVVAQNKARRHIQQGQIALAVAAVYQWRPLGSNQHGGSAPGAHPPKTNSQLAKIAGTSERTMRQAKTVEAKAAPKVKEAVKKGEISVKRAAEIAALPAKDQVKELTKAKLKIAAVTPDTDEGPTDDEIAASQKAIDDELEELRVIALADDKLAAALASVKKLTALNRVLTERNNGLMGEKNAAIALAQKLQRRLDKLERVAA
jgi:hypothetical protein